MLTMTRLTRCAQLAMLLSSFTSAQLCSTSFSTTIKPCRDQSCPGVNPASIKVNDRVTFEVCVENQSQEYQTEKGASAKGVSAVLRADTTIQVILACKPSDGQPTCEAGQWPRAFTFLDFTPSADSPDVKYTRGLQDPNTFSCTDDNLCGELHFPNDIDLPPQKTSLLRHHQHHCDGNA